MKKNAIFIACNKQREAAHTLNELQSIWVVIGGLLQDKMVLQYLTYILLIVTINTIVHCPIPMLLILCNLVNYTFMNT